MQLAIAVLLLGLIRFISFSVIGMSMKYMLKGKNGTTLVEILVVMVVLLIGIMTVVQMFPTGFRVVRAAESQTIATRLAQQELERWKNMTENLPAGIVAVDESSDFPVNVISDQMPLYPFKGILDKDGTRGNALNVRYVLGETTKIPVASYFQSGNGATYGSKYELAFSPIDYTVDTQNASVVTSNVTVKGGDMKRIDGDSRGDVPYLRAGQYAIDYTVYDGVDPYQKKPVFYMAFPKDVGVSDRVYYLTYSYWAKSDNSGDLVMLTNVDQKITVASGNVSEWLQVPINVASGYSLVSIADGTDVCARGFVELPMSAAFSDDSPYEFKVADQIMGVIAFNPAGNGTYEYTGSGVKPLQAQIDYKIYDLRIIREDKVVPDLEYTDAPNLPVKLSLKFILNIGDTTDNPNEEEYKGLITSSHCSVTAPFPLYIVDLATGLRVEMPPVTENGATTIREYDSKADDHTKQLGGIDYKNGVVYLPVKANLVDFSGTVVASNQSLAGRHLRFFYRADGDWSVQCQKAYANYSRVYDVAGVDYRHFCVDPDVAGELLFAQCDAAKTVSLDYTYVLSGVEHKVTAESYQISDSTDDTYSNYCYIKLNSDSFPDGAKLSRVVVSGTSFKVRVIWRDGTNWRHVDMDTSLVRNSD